MSGGNGVGSVVSGGNGEHSGMSGSSMTSGRAG